MGMDLGDAKITITAKDEYSAAVANVQTRLEGMKDSLRKVGIAMTAVGVAGLKMVSDARQLNAQLGQTAITIGSTSQEMRGLVLSTTDVTFSLQSVASTFELLARAGVRNTEVMQKSAKAFDALADATGSTAEVVADLLLPAFKLFGEEIPTTFQELDKFTWMTKKTLVGLDDFGTLLTRMAPYMDTLNMSMDDAIATLAALGEQGIIGTAATLKLRTAITQAASSGEDLNTILGISQEEIAGFKQQMFDATGITAKYAAVANEQFGIMDKIKQKFSELTLKLGSVLKPLEPILAAITALGPIMIFLSTQMGINTLLWVKHTIAVVASKVALIAHTIASKGAAAAMWLLNEAMSANPFVLLAIAISAVVGALFIFRNRVDSTTREATEDFQALATDAKVAFDSIALAGKTMTDSLRQDIVNAIDPMFDDIIAKLESRKGDFIKAFVGMYSDAKTMSQEEMATTINRITSLFDEELAVVKEGKERINEIYSNAAEKHRGLTEAENIEVLNIWRDMYSTGFAIASEGSKKYEDIWLELASAGEKISNEMYGKILGMQVDAAKQEIENANTRYEELEKLALENVGILTGYTQAMADADIANADRERREVIRIYKEQTIALEGELDKRISAWDKFWMQVGEKIQYLLFSTPSPSAEFKAVSEIKIPTLPSLQYGGIVPGAIGQPVPVMAHGGEPFGGVGGTGMTINRETHIHIGHFLGDELSLRQFTRKLQEIMREEERRTAFSGINTGYFFGGSHI